MSPIEQIIANIDGGTNYTTGALVVITDGMYDITTIRKWCKSGNLKADYDGGRWWVTGSDAIDFFCAKIGKTRKKGIIGKYGSI